MINSPQPAGAGSAYTQRARTNLLQGLTAKRFLVVLAINTVVAACLTPIGVWKSFDSALVSAHIVGLSIMLAALMALNWRQSPFPPLVTQLLSVVVGSAVGTILVILVKGYELETVVKDPEGAINLLILGATIGAFTILISIARDRETRAQAAMHMAEAERHLHGKQLLEARLQLLQAQIEPHFLFNTLASVQHLVETEPAAASRMLGDLIKYLRAAMPQMREHGSTIGREAELARAYLSIQRVRTGGRFDFVIDIPDTLLDQAFPPMMMLTLVENALKHGFEKQSGSGEICVSARRDAGYLTVEVTDNGAGFRTDSTDGVGLTNVRERLKALYGDTARLVLEENSPGGVRARISLPENAAGANFAQALPAPVGAIPAGSPVAGNP